MDRINLGEIVKIKTGKLDANVSSENGKYPFFTCSKDPLTIDTYSYDIECILVAGNGDLNVKYYNGKFDAYQRTYILEVCNKEIYNTKYVYYFMCKYIEILRNEAIGGVIKYIKLNNLTQAKIPIVDIGKQKEIVNIISYVENIINLKKKQIIKLDELIKSQFVEMFGDPVFNNKNWKYGIIRDLVKDVRYGTSRPANENGRFKYLRMNNITYDGKLDITELKNIDIPDNELEKCIAEKGDILFNRTNSRDLVGKTCVYDLDDSMVIAGFVIRVRTNELANPYFVSEFLNSKYMKKRLSNMCKNASGQSNINAQEMQNIKIYIPPIELQNQFAEFVKQIDKQKFEIEKSLKEMEELYESLMDKYFG